MREKRDVSREEREIIKKKLAHNYSILLLVEEYHRMC